MGAAIPWGGDGFLARREGAGDGVTHGPVADLTRAVGTVLWANCTALPRGVHRILTGWRGAGRGLTEMVTVYNTGMRTVFTVSCIQETENHHNIMKLIIIQSCIQMYQCIRTNGIMEEEEVL